ncbi:hypothetical protein F5Y17DRAFT_417817 [Xylariaceae sp. FL0594]|nr:hypothetical protein F5Y17DRAFT_417817 [Xylariaceae sp. FL0594]
MFPWAFVLFSFFSLSMVTRRDAHAQLTSPPSLPLLSSHTEISGVNVMYGIPHTLPRPSNSSPYPSPSFPLAGSRTTMAKLFSSSSLSSGTGKQSSRRRLNTRSLAVILLSSGISAILIYLFALRGSLAPYGFYSLNNPFSSSSQKQEVLEVVFREHDDYKDLAPERDYLWADLLTPNGGFLVREDESEEGGGGLRRYGIGMFHQLHCLQMIRGALQQKGQGHVHGHEHEKRSENAHGHDHGGDDAAAAHVLHCLDYLRQTILCVADDTIEIPKRRPDGRNVIDGMFTHKCRNPEPLYELSRSSPEYHAPASYSHVEGH